MKIIYHCFGGTHSSVLAAAIHMKMLSEERIPTNEEILNLPYYDKISSDSIGTPICYGMDEFGNKVFILGSGKSKKIILNTIYSFLAIERIKPEDVYLVNTLKYINIIVRFGGFLSRGLGLIFPGRILTVYGLKLSYHRFVEAIRKVKEEITIA